MEGFAVKCEISKFLLTFISLLLLLSAILCSEEKNKTIYKQLIHGEFTTTNWTLDNELLFYINISDYNLNEENVVEFVNPDLDLYRGFRTYLLTTNETEEKILNHEVYPMSLFPRQNYSLKVRPVTQTYSYMITFKKTNTNQKYHLILFKNVEITKKFALFEISLSQRIPTIKISNNQIKEGNFFSKKLKVNPKVQNFYKFYVENTPVNSMNLLFFIDQFYIPTYFPINLTIVQSINNRMHIINKGSTKDVNHTVYLGLLGQTKEIEIFINLDNHDIIPGIGTTKFYQTLYLEQLNCKKDLYILENYTPLSRLNDQEYHLMMTPIYGNFTLTYYGSFNTSNFQDFFQKNKGELVTDKIKIILGISNIFKLTCKTPSSLRFGYIKENNLPNKIKEGDEILSYLTPGYYNEKEIVVLTEDETKKYILHFELLEDEKNFNKSIINITRRTSNKNSSETINCNNTIYEIILFHDKNSSTTISFHTVTGGHIKWYLTSNSLFEYIVEGINQINFDTKNLLFKFSREVIFDYVTLEAKSGQKNTEISLGYKLKKINKKYKEEDKILTPLPRVNIINKNDIFLNFSNPYEKFNLYLEKDEYVYLVISLFIPNEYWPVYIDIRYFYNNSVVALKQSNPKVLVAQQGYELEDNKLDKNNKLILNINKCYSFKYYQIQTYYENTKNIILMEDIKNERNIFLHENIFNRTKIIITKNDTKNSIKSYSQADYYNNGDILLNYFSVNETLYMNQEITQEFQIQYKDNRRKITFSWPKYIKKSEGISELTVKYSLYILPKESPINSICQMSIIPPNITVINKTFYEIKLNQGEYKVNLIASVINEEFPMMTFYNMLYFNVPIRFNDPLIFILSVIFFVVIITLLVVFYVCIYKKKDKITLNNVYNKFPSSSNNAVISLAFRDSISSEEEVNLRENNNTEIINKDEKNIPFEKDN